MSGETIKTLSLDPARDAFTWALFHDEKLQETGYLDIPTEVHWNVFSQYIEDFMGKFRDLIKQCKLDPKDSLIACERYHTNPDRVGPHVEQVSMMVGVAAASAYPIPFWPIHPVSWKAWTKKIYGHNDMPRLLEDMGYDITHHEADAIGIGNYAYSQENHKQGHPLREIIVNHH